MDQGGLLFKSPIFLPFHTVHGALGKSTEVVCHSLLQGTTFWQALRHMPSSHSAQPDDVPGDLVVPLLVLVDCANFHCAWGVGQCVSWRPGQRPSGVAGNV